MATCKDCLHYQTCGYVMDMSDEEIDAPNAENDCQHFVADVVEVVRCEKCKHADFQYNTDKYPFGVYSCKKQPAGRAYKKVKGDFFCSYGERRNQAVEKQGS